MNYEAIRFSMDGPVARITLARPDSDNRVDERLLRELEDACARIAGAAAVRSVVLDADGAHFSTGWATTVVSEGTVLERPPADCFGVLASLPQPVVVAIQGRADSAGLELALACDVRIAADDAEFAMPETEVGLMPLAGATQRLPRIAGRGVALAMLLAGERLDAESASRAGLVSKVVQRAILAAEADRIAVMMASRGPLALRYAKEAVHKGLDMTLEQAMRYETDLTVILQTTEDRAEGVRAFFEGRRAPRFTGR